MEGDMPKKDMGLKKKNRSMYMGGGVFKPNAPVSSSFRGGGATEVGTEKKVQSYKEYAKKMFGGGVTKKALGGALDLGAPLDVSGQQGATSSGKSSAGLGKGITGRRLGTKRRLGRRGPAVRRTKADDRGM